MKLVPGFHHIPGTHCGSTAMRDLLRHIGTDLSEAMCFGLGSGLGFYYFRSPTDSSPSRILYGRTATLERDLCAHLELDFVSGADDNMACAWQTAKDLIDVDIPVLLHVELSQLPYYNTRTPFPGHRVVLAGYDDVRDVALLADTQFPGLQEVLGEVLCAARSAQIPPIPLRGEWLAIRPTRPPARLTDALTRALRDNAQWMVVDRAPDQGVMGMETLAEDFINWDTSPDWELCARFGYQNVEVRGTGGGFFRKMYAQFLRKVETLSEPVRAAKLADTMDEIADAWSQFGALLKRISEEKNRAGLADASNAVRRLAKREEDFWGKVLDALG